MNTSIKSINTLSMPIQMHLVIISGRPNESSSEVLTSQSQKLE